MSIQNYHKGHALVILKVSAFDCDSHELLDDAVRESGV